LTGWSNKIGALLFPILLIIACQVLDRSNDENDEEQVKVARVGNHFLYQSDLASIVNEKMSPEDSLEACNYFVNDWVKNRLVLHKSYEYLPENLKEIKRQAKEYEESLMMYLYETRLIQQNLDTLVSEEEISSYYEENGSNFVLKEAIAKARYFILRKESPKMDSLRIWVNGQGEENYDKLSDYGFQYASKFSADGEWFKTTELANRFPLNAQNVSDFLSKNEFIEVSDEKSNYVIQIAEYIPAGKVAPLEYKAYEIEKIIIKRRKLKYGKELRNKIFEDALNKGEFDIYDK